MTGWESGWGLDFLVFMSNLGGRPLDILMEPFAFIGGEYGYTILMPLVFWSINDRMGRRLYALAMGSAMVNGILKAWWARPRPFQVAPDRIDPFHIEESYGIPSGHTQGGTVLGLFFAGETRRNWLKTLLYVGIFLMGISRMIHGVHFLQDVLAGWLIGFMVFAVYGYFERRILPRLAESPAAVLWLLSLVPAVLAILSEYLFRGSFPATKSLLASGGALTGILLGMVVERGSGYFRSSGAVWKRILRVPIGLAVVFAVTVGMSLAFGMVFSETPGFIGVAVYVIRYAITGIVGFWLVPQIFILCRLADRRVPREALK